jgi:uncharacterized protein (TIGR00255 family)
MTGFARVNNSCLLNDEEVSWVWEIKSVNGKSLELKSRLPVGYDDLSIALKNAAAKYLNRGNVSVCLEIQRTNKNKQVVIDEAFLEKVTDKAIMLYEKHSGKIAQPTAVELLALRGVIEVEESVWDEDTQHTLKQKILADYETLCQNLHRNRIIEGQKIQKVLIGLLDKIKIIVDEIDEKAKDLPEKLRQKLKEQVENFVEMENFNEDRIAQEIVLLVTKADIREEIDRLGAHIKAAKELLENETVVGRKLDFLCQELNREANTTCSKSMDIAITNYGMDLKSLIEQFREQVQNIE